MAEGSDDEKTEDATPKKRQEARDKGQVALSRELNTWVLVAMSALLCATTFGYFAQNLASYFTVFLAQPHSFALDGSGARRLFADIIFSLGPYILLPILCLLVAGILAPLAQIGPLLTWSRIEPKLSKINPLSGLKRLFGLQSLVELVKGVTKLTVIGLAAAVVLKPFVIHGAAIVGQDIDVILGILREEILQLFMMTLSITFVLAAADFMYQRYTLNKSLKMTKQEVKDEYKQSEGDPTVKGKIKQMRAQKARQRMMARVPEASVVITNPTHYAIALEYDREKMNAPVVSAKGMDAVALRIRALAEEHDVPIVENPPLARALHGSLEIDDEITEEHYKAVAEVISYVYSLKGRR
jgi:flagellar biosynthetic protein FlhB